MVQISNPPVVDPLGLGEQAGDPATVANRGSVYAKDVLGITELFYVDSGGSVIQITENGKFASSGIGVNRDDLLELDNNAGANTGWRNVSDDDRVALEINGSELLVVESSGDIRFGALAVTDYFNKSTRRLFLGDHGGAPLLGGNIQAFVNNADQPGLQAGMAAITTGGLACSCLTLETYTNEVTVNPLVTIRRARGEHSTKGTPLTLLNNDLVAKFVGEGHNGTSFSEVAKIQIDVDGTPGGSGVPGEMSFHTHSGTGLVKHGNLRSSGMWEIKKPAFDEVTPAQLAGNVNNYNPGDGTVFRVSSDASRNITGLVPTGGNPAGRPILLVNVGSFDVVLTNQDAASTDVNRIITGTGASVTLAADDTAQLSYDGTTTRWRIIT